MNPNRAENHPQPEVAQGAETPELAQGQAVEQAPSAQENAAGRQAPQTTTVLPVVDPATLATPSAAVPITDDNIQTREPGSSAAAAKNTDRIEREWVDKAKEIVMRTQDDPHAQKEAVSKVKAEYIQKRFNKIIRTDSAAI